MVDILNLIAYETPIPLRGATNRRNTTVNRRLHGYSSITKHITEMSNKPASNARMVEMKPAWYNSSVEDALFSLQQILKEAKTGLITARTIRNAEKAMRPFAPAVAEAAPDLDFIGAPSKKND